MIAAAAREWIRVLEQGLGGSMDARQQATKPRE